MRTTDERMAELARRVKKADREKTKRRSRIFALGATAFSLALIVAASLAMPGAMEHIAGNEYAYAGPAASIFMGSSVLGFIVIGVLAFALGVCVTILCYMLRGRDKGGEHDRGD